ncbi:MAG: transglutaminase domain-containing protein [Erysipelotrichaceae bacterium]
MVKRVLCLWIVGILILSGCSFQTSFREDITHDTTWTSDSAYFGKGMKFELASSDLFEPDQQVFWIHDEEELALILAIKFDEGIYTVEYLSEIPLATDKVISYLVSLFVHDFEYFDGTVEYSDYGVFKFESEYVTLESKPTENIFVEKEIDEWTKDIKSKELDPADEAKYLHDRIITEVRYDDVAAKNPDRETDAFSAMGVFEDKKAVCNGYSQAYLGLMKEMEIPAILISSDTDDHAWNMVYIGNEWQYVDTTWDDMDTKIEKPIYDYFLKDTNEFLDHEFDETGYMTLSKEDYTEFAKYVFPQTHPTSP